MAWIIGGAALLSGYMGSQASQNAADTQANAANNAASNQRNMWNMSNAQMQPWIQSGQTAVQQMNNMMGPGGSMNHMPTSSEIMSQFAPNYQFQLQQGMGQAGNMANATGGLVSGNAMQGLNSFAQNYAGNAYQNAFNNYNVGQSNIFNRLASIAGLGQTSAGQSMAGGNTAAANMGNFSTSAAAANAAGQVGSTNAWTGAINNLGSLAYLNGMGGNPQSGTTTNP